MHSTMNNEQYDLQLTTCVPTIISCTNINITYTCQQHLCRVRVANSHAYGVILTHLTCYSRTHAIDKFTHAFKRNHTHTHALYKIENNLLFLIIVTF